MEDIAGHYQLVIDSEENKNKDNINNLEEFSEEENKKIKLFKTFKERYLFKFLTGVVFLNPFLKIFVKYFSQHKEFPLNLPKAEEKRWSKYLLILLCILFLIIHFTVPDPFTRSCLKFIDFVYILTHLLLYFEVDLSDLKSLKLIENFRKKNMK